MNILGISAGFHDAAATIINRNGDILFAGHSERYSKKKNDENFSAGLINDIVHYGSEGGIDTIAYYERPLYKQLRQLYSGQGIELDKLSVRKIVEQQLSPIDISDKKIKNYNHHLSHAAAGFQTSPYDQATVVVIDAIGEMDTISIFRASYDREGRARYKRVWKQTYPHSIGLFYSAITEYVGLKPMEEEYILMGMAAYGKKDDNALLLPYILKSEQDIELNENYHIGIDNEFLRTHNNEDIATAAQHVAEQLIYSVMKLARKITGETNLVYMGGVALNCLANRNLGDYFDRIWIMPNPGDAGSSLGAAALAFGRRLNWIDPYLGGSFSMAYPVADALAELKSKRMVGVASGRAEFGPRALGNRSLLADPRGPDIKDLVNEIKRRQKFRPFAPVILEEHVDEFFSMPRGWPTSPYMQSVGVCRFPELYPAIVHHDGTSRVQTVPKDSRSGIRQLLEEWHRDTGCPMLLNTSLNIRGEPMVNDRADADRFEKLYGIKVLS